MSSRRPSPATQSPPLPYGYGIYVLLEALGADPDSDDARLERRSKTAMQSGLIVDAVIAKSESERRAIWSIREDVFQTRRYGADDRFRREPVAIEHGELHPAGARVGCAGRTPTVACSRSVTSRMATCISA